MVVAVAHSLTHSLTCCAGTGPGNGGGGKGGEVRPGDWLCNNCGANNFASRTACFRCQTPKPPGGGGSGSYGGLSDGPTGYGGGKGGGSGGGGDVRPGDWTCPNCGANVFASKNNCFRCQTPRPGGVGGVGGPMGAGGGGERSSSVAARKVNAGMPACRVANGCLACWRLGVRFRPVCRLWRRWRALLSSRTWCTDVTSVEASTGGGVVSERGGDGAGASVEPEAGRAFEAGRRRGEAWSRRPRWCVEVQVQVQVLEQEREVGARWPVAVRRVHLHGLGRLQSELRRPRGARWDGIAGYLYRKGRTGRREEGCGSMRERYQPGTRRGEDNGHAPASSSTCPQEPKRTSAAARRPGASKVTGGGAEGRCIALTVVMGCCGCTAVTPCTLQLHPARPT